MKNILQLFVISFLFFNCSSSRYVLTSAEILNKQNPETCQINYIALSNEQLNNSSILKGTLYYMERKDNKGLKKMFDSLDAQQVVNSEFYLAKILFRITKKHYMHASKELVMVRDTQYKALKELLEVDMKYELRKRADEETFHNALKQYQTLSDKFPNEEVLRKILKVRVRYIRYNTKY